MLEIRRHNYGWDVASAILLEQRGDFHGQVRVSLDEAGAQVIGTGKLQISCENWKLYEVPAEKCSGTHALYFTFTGEGSLDMRSLGLS